MKTALLAFVLFATPALVGDPLESKFVTTGNALQKLVDDITPGLAEDVGHENVARMALSHATISVNIHARYIQVLVAMMNDADSPEERERVRRKLALFLPYFRKCAVAANACAEGYERVAASGWFHERRSRIRDIMANYLIIIDGDLSKLASP